MGRSIALCAAMVTAGLWGNQAYAQQQRPSARVTAPLDVTGQWVSVVSEDWRWRMVTPAKGDVISIPVNANGRKAANEWNYADDLASGRQCLSYGAGGLMRVPTRVRISWDNDNTLKLETDAGSQLQRFRFANGGAQAEEAPSLQGTAAAEWVDLVARGAQQGAAGGGGGAAQAAARPPLAPYGNGTLKVEFSRFMPGYLRKNGVPYSQDATITEYFDRVPGPTGAEWLIVKTIVDDPQYLARPYITTAHFLKEQDLGKWNPTPCVVDPPVTPPAPEED